MARRMLGGRRIRNPAMPEASAPGGSNPARFIRSRVRVPTPTPGADADRVLAERHGYKPPEPPPGTDPRLWCEIHHRLMHISRPPFRWVHCPLCLPEYQGATAASTGRVSIRTGLRCARDRCKAIARYDLWGVPVCGATCVARVGDGAPVRPLRCVLRVVAIPCPRSERWIILACYPLGYQSWDAGFRTRMVRLHWWLPARDLPGSTRLVIPPIRAIERLRATRLGTRVGACVSVHDDDVMAHFLQRLTRALAPVSSFPDLRVALFDWRRGGVRPWIDTTLEPAIRHGQQVIARMRAGLEKAEVRKQDRISGAIVTSQMRRELRRKPFEYDAEGCGFALPEPADAAPDLGLDGHEGQPGADDEPTPEPKTHTG